MKTPRGTKIYQTRQGRTFVLGVTTGGTRKCTGRGCPGYKIAVRWNGGQLSWICTTDLSSTKKGWRFR